MIYLIKNDDVIDAFDDVISWGMNFIEFDNGGFKCKVYSEDGCYFTDIKPENKNL